MARWNGEKDGSLEWGKRWLAGMKTEMACRNGGKDGLPALPEWPSATVERNAVWKRIMSRNNCRLPDCRLGMNYVRGLWENTKIHILRSYAKIHTLRSTFPWYDDSHILDRRGGFNMDHTLRSILE